MKPSRRHVGIAFQPGKARVIYQPLGVVGIIVLWNYPLFLAMGPLTAALAAGNRAMIKMSEATPATARVFSEMLAEVFPADQTAVITGEAEVGMAFSKGDKNSLFAAVPISTFRIVFHQLVSPTCSAGRNRPRRQ